MFHRITFLVLNSQLQLAKKEPTPNKKTGFRFQQKIDFPLTSCSLYVSLSDGARPPRSQRLNDDDAKQVSMCYLDIQKFSKSFFFSVVGCNSSNKTQTAVEETTFEQSATKWRSSVADDYLPMCLGWQGVNGKNVRTKDWIFTQKEVLTFTPF